MQALLIFLFISLPTLVTAADTGFVPLIGIPGVTSENLTTSLYLNRLYQLAIVAAAFIAVAKIIFAGVKYALSEIVTDKSDAKKDIWAGILGLLVIIGAITILQEINPRLTTFNFLSNLPTPVIQKFEIRRSEVVTDESGAINLEGLSNEKRAEILKKISCPAGSKIIIANNEARCSNSSDVNQGSAFNTSDRFDKFSDRFNPTDGSEGVFNQFVSPFEPDGIETSNIIPVITAVGGDDYLFVVKKLESDSDISNAELIRDQQNILCEKGDGSLEDSTDGTFSVCVVINE